MTRDWDNPRPDGAPINDHTLQPWSLTDEGLIVAADGRPIFGAYRSADERLAITHLLAAAPDMLAALKAIREWLLDSNVIKQSEAKFCNEDFIRANNLAHEAIAKAEGRS